MKYLRDCFVVEDNFVEEDESRFKVIIFEGFFGTFQFFQDFVFFDPAVVEFL